MSSVPNVTLTSTFEEVYKAWRNRARRFDPQSIVLTALGFLQQQLPTKLADLERFPWQVLLIVKWVCQDHQMDRARAPSINIQQFDDLRQRLWDFPEKLGSRIRDTLPGKLFFRQLMNPQLGFQRRFSSGFIREAAILAAQPDNNSLRRMFEEKTRLSPRDFLDLAFAAYSGILDGRHKLSAAWFDPALNVYPRETVDAFIRAVSLDFRELQQFCRRLPNANRHVQSELFEFPILTRYPFLRLNGELHCWHPMVFFRGMEGFVHSMMSELGPTYIEPFSKLFEKHVLSETAAVPALLYDEPKIRTWLPLGARVPDGLLSYPGFNVFIESKAGLFDESIMCVGHTERFSHMTRALRVAIDQAWSASTLLRQEGRAPDTVRNATKDFLLIVTNRDVNTSNGRSLAAMYPPDTLVPSIPDATRYLPIEHIYILSIEDFERLVHGLAAVETSLPQFLEDCVAADGDPVTAVFCFEQHLMRRRIPLSYSHIVQDEIDSIAKRLECALVGQGDPPNTA